MYTDFDIQTRWKQQQNKKNISAKASSRLRLRFCNSKNITDVRYEVWLSKSGKMTILLHFVKCWGPFVEIQASGKFVSMWASRHTYIGLWTELCHTLSWVCEGAHWGSMHQAWASAHENVTVKVTGKWVKNVVCGLYVHGGEYVGRLPGEEEEHQNCSALPSSTSEKNPTSTLLFWWNLFFWNIYLLN